MFVSKEALCRLLLLNSLELSSLYKLYKGYKGLHGASEAGKLPIMMPATEADTIPPAQGPLAMYSEGMLTSYRNRSRKAPFKYL